MKYQLFCDDKKNWFDVECPCCKKVEKINTPALDEVIEALVNWNEARAWSYLAPAFEEIREKLKNG